MLSILLELSYIFLIFRYTTVFIIMKIKILVFINFLNRGCLSSVNPQSIRMNIFIYKGRIVCMVQYLYSIINIIFLYFLWIIFCVSLFIFMKIWDLIFIFCIYEIIFHNICWIILRFCKNISFDLIWWAFDMMVWISRILNCSLYVVCSFIHSIWQINYNLFSII